MPHHQPNALNYLIPLLVLLPVLYLRLRRMLKPQALKLNRLWIRPAIYLVVAAIALAAPVPGAPAFSPDIILWLALAAVVGAAAGWRWGRTTALHLDPQNGTLMQTGSMAGIIVFLLLVLVKFGLRAGLQLGAPGLHVNTLLVTDVSIVFSALLFSVRGLEIFLRARRMTAAGF